MGDGREDVVISSTNVVSKLKDFTSANRFKKAAIHIIAHHIDDAKIKQLRGTFEAMDTNGDGELSFEEIKVGFRNSGLGDFEEMKKLFDQLDTDGSGSIGYTEFLAAMMDQKDVLTKKEQCWEAFRVFDKDGNESIDMSEFLEIMKDYDMSGDKGLNKAELEAMFREADEDGNGKIDFTEFTHM